MRSSADYCCLTQPGFKIFLIAAKRRFKVLCCVAIPGFKIFWFRAEEIENNYAMQQVYFQRFNLFRVLFAK